LRDIAAHNNKAKLFSNVFIMHKKLQRSTDEKCAYTTHSAERAREMIIKILQKASGERNEGENKNYTPRYFRRVGECVCAFALHAHITYLNHIRINKLCTA
jgi:hypothetical protein